MAKKFTPDELNRAADNYCTALRLMQAGDTSEATIRLKDESGLAVLDMVEPLLLSYYRFLTGQRTTLSGELFMFVSLFRRPGDPTDQDTIVYRIVQGVRRVCLDCAEHDCTTSPEEGVVGYRGNELYGWFLDILFGSILPEYRQRFRDDGVRINFFRAFQVRFRYELARKVKEQIGWEGRRHSIETYVDEGASFPAEDKERLRRELGLNDVEWRCFLAMSRRDREPKRMTRAQRLVEETVKAKVSAYRTAVQASGSGRDTDQPMQVPGE